MKTWPIFLMFIANTSIAAPTWDKFEFSDLRQLIIGKKITNLDDLVKHFPQGMKQNTILIYNSEALHPEFATKEKPRMLFFNNSGTLAITIAGNHGESVKRNNLDVLEVVTFNKDSGKFELYVDSFNGKKVPFKKLEKNPATCLSCHGQDPRPLFHDYNGWPGIYGSFGTQGLAAINSDEGRGLSTFLSEAKSMARYSDLDLSGYYNYPKSDRKDKEGNIIVPAGSGGIAFRAQNVVGGHKALIELISASPNLQYGMGVETLMHKKLAKKLSLRDDYKTVIFPLFYYLGNTSQEAGKVEGRCGHPAENVRAVYEKISQIFPDKNENTLQAAIKKIEVQILKDHLKRQKSVELANILSPIVDARGIASIPYTAFYPTPTNNSPDSDAFRKQTALMEVLFQRLNFKSEDISSAKDTPTTGIYHLSRLGRMAIDEKYFQNLMVGFEWASPTLKNQFDKLDCEKVEQLALNSVEKLFSKGPLKLKYDGIQYKN